MVHWTDAVGSDGPECVPTDALTAGWLVEVTETYLKVASEIFCDGDRRMHTAIPRGMIISIKRILKVEPESFKGWSTR